MDYIQSLHAQGQKAHDHFGWLFYLGLFNMALGFLALAFVNYATLLAMLYLGWIFILTGVATIVFSYRLQKIGGHWSQTILGTLAIVCGIIMLIDPARDAMVLTLLAGVFILTSGLVSIIASLFSSFPHRVSVFFSGVFSLFCAYIIYSQLPFSGTWVVGTFIGIYLIIHGFTQAQIGMVGRRSFPKREQARA